MKYTNPVNNTVPHEKLSKRYTLIDTQALLDIAINKGFSVASTQYSRGKNSQFSQHTVRLDLPGYQAKVNKEYRPQIIVRNSHDGTSSIYLIGGVFRLICMNGLVAGNTFLNIRMRHVGLKQKTIEESLEIAAAQVVQLHDSVEKFKAIQLSDDQLTGFTIQALKLRAKIAGLSENEEYSLIRQSGSKAHRPKRHQDVGHGLWEVFNRVQENMVKNSGLSYMSDDNKLKRLYSVNAIAPSISLNQSLWELAEKYSEAA